MRFRFTAPAWAILAANMVPLIMLALGLWNVTDTLVLYWAETAVVGIFNLLAILTACAPGPRCGKPLTLQRLRNADSSQTLPRLVDEWGIFGKLVVALISMVPFTALIVLQALLLHFVFPDVSDNLSDMLWNVRWGLAALAGGRAVWFFAEYIGGGEFRRTRPEALMDRYAPRMFIMQAALAVGGGMYKNWGRWEVMIAFVIAKLLMDLRPEGGYIGSPGSLFERHMAARKEGRS